MRLPDQHLPDVWVLSLYFKYTTTRSVVVKLWQWHFWVCQKDGTHASLSENKEKIPDCLSFDLSIQKQFSYSLHSRNGMCFIDIYVVKNVKLIQISNAYLKQCSSKSWHRWPKKGALKEHNKHLQNFPEEHDMNLKILNTFYDILSR